MMIGCGSANPPPEEPPERISAPTETTETHPRLPGCGPADTPELTSWLEVTAGDGVPRHVEVVRDARNGVWMPAENIRMPMHHATAIRWTNLASLSLLPTSTDARLRFTFTLLDREIRHVAEHQWRTEYTAEISAVCAVTDDARPIGVHVPDVHGPADADCSLLENAVEAAARAAAQCSTDAECVIRDVSACDLRGVGCYWVALHRDASTEGIEAAIRRHESSGCPTSDCDCAGPPHTARCVDGTCAGAAN